MGVGLLTFLPGRKEAPSGATSRATAAAARLSRFAREEKAFLPSIPRMEASPDTDSAPETGGETEALALKRRRETRPTFVDNIAALPELPSRS